MSDRRWVRVTACDNIPLREGRPALVGDREIAIFNMGDGRYLASENTCPHRGGPLCDGIVSGRAVVCPLHAWKVNLETGHVERPEGGSGCVQTYPVRLENGVIVIGLPRAGAGMSQPEPTEGQAA